MKWLSGSVHVLIDEVVRLAVQCVLIVLYLPPSSRPFALIVCATLGKSREPNEIAREGGVGVVCGCCRRQNRLMKLSISGGFCCDKFLPFFFVLRK